MTDYYVQIRKGGAWHILSTVLPLRTRCDIQIRGVAYAGSALVQQPLCKRCERSKR